MDQQRNNPQQQHRGMLGGTGQQVAERAQQKEKQFADKGRQMADKASQSEPVRALMEEGHELGHEAGETLKHYVDDAARSGKQQIKERLQHMSKALHRASDTLKNDEEETTGQYADQAARQIDRLCGFIEKHEPSDLIKGVDSFARKQPFVFVGTALVAGLLAGRFLRSSPSEDKLGTDRYEKQSEDVDLPNFGESRRTPVGGIGTERRGIDTNPISSRPLTGSPRPRGGTGDIPGGQGGSQGGF